MVKFSIKKLEEMSNVHETYDRKLQKLKTRGCGLHLLDKGNYTNGRAVKMPPSHCSVVITRANFQTVFDRYLNSHFGAERAPLSY